MAAPVKIQAHLKAGVFVLLDLVAHDVKGQVSPAFLDYVVKDVAFKSIMKKFNALVQWAVMGPFVRKTLKFKGPTLMAPHLSLTLFHQLG